jgi:hypothetical protein
MLKGNLVLLNFFFKGLPGSSAVGNVIYRQGEKGEKGNDGERGIPVSLKNYLKKINNC